MEAYPKVYLYKRIVQAKLFIDRHYAEQIDLDAISEEAYFSKFHFIRLFKIAYGKTPHKYLTHVRIERAKEMLSQGVSVADACFAVGFESITSFTGLFKKVTRQTPSVYQAGRLALQAAIAEKPLRFIPGCFAEKKGWKESIPQF